MATYRIDITSDEQTITGATYDTCITGLSMDLNEDPNQIVISTGATNGNFTMHCTANAHEQSREYTYRLVYTYDGGSCEHDIHLVQSGASETEGLSFFAKITNNTNSPINVTAIGFDINESGEEEEFHNQQVIDANSTADYNNGNPICLITCDNTYTIANISNFYIEIDDATYTATCDKTIIRDGDTITLTYNG